MKKLFIFLIIITFVLMQLETFADCSGSSCDSCSSCKPSCSQDVCATLNCPPPPPPPPDGNGGGNGGGGNGGVVGIAVGGSAGAAAGATALAFAPVLLAGLGPNPCICAACPLVCGSPLGCACPLDCYLQTAFNNSCAIKCINGIYYFNPQDSLYIAQSDSTIANGTYEIDEIILPNELKSAKRLKVNITIASQPYKEICKEPELALGLYKDISKCNLSKKFETQQFMHNYLMRRYEVPLNITCKNYCNGLQRLSGTINLCQIQDKSKPLSVVVRYTQDGFRKNQKNMNPRTLIYAYLIEIERA